MEVRPDETSRHQIWHYVCKGREKHRCDFHLLHYMDSFTGLSGLWRQCISVVLRLWLACRAQCPVLSVEQIVFKFLHTVSTVFSVVLLCGTGWNLAANRFELTIRDFCVPLLGFFVLFLFFCPKWRLCPEKALNPHFVFKATQKTCPLETCAWVLHLLEADQYRIHYSDWSRLVTESSDFK